jgi:hypothetical protein
VIASFLQRILKKMQDTMLIAHARFPTIVSGNAHQGLHSASL